MALIFHLLGFENVKGKLDRIVKVTFRGNTQSSKVLQDVGGQIEINETFEWPIARAMEKDEVIKMEMFNYNKYLSNRLVGRYSIVAQELIQTGNIALRDFLTDDSNSVLKTSVDFEVTYHSPDGLVGEWVMSGMDDHFSGAAGWGDIETGSLAGSTESILERKSLYDSTYFRMDFNEDEISLNLEPPPDLLSHVKRQIPPELDAAFPKAKHFQVGITVIEARQLSGLDIDPVVVLQVGDQQKCTGIRKSTNCPFWNEYFAFDFEMPKEMFLDQVLMLTVLASNPIMQAQGVLKNYFQLGKTIGIFKMDVNSVWEETGHQYYHRWAPLIDPDNLASGVKGYLKCIIAASQAQAQPVVIAPAKPANDDDIEKALMLPKEIPYPRQAARYTVKIYRARDLPRMELGVMSSIKKALTSEDSALVDPCVFVSFGGVRDSTSVRSGTYDPVWNEEITFTDFMPPLYRRMKIELVDHNTLKDDVIGTHYIDLDEISYGGKQGGFQPVLGPCWINLYGADRTFQMFDSHNYLNQGVGEGVAYRGSVLISITSTWMTGMTSSGSLRSIRQPTQLISAVASGKMAEYFLYSSFLHVSMINPKLAGKPIHFEISIGNYGNTIDGGTVVRHSVGGEDEDEDDGPPAPAEMKSFTPPMKPETVNRTNMMGQSRVYYHLPYDEKKPCVYVKAMFEDQRKRMYIANYLEKIVIRMERGFSELEQIQTHNMPYDCVAIIKLALQMVAKDCQGFVSSIAGSWDRQGAGKSALDKERLKLLEYKMGKYSKKFRELRANCKESTLDPTVLQAKNYLRKIKKLMNEPQHSLPDVFVWMCMAKKRIACCRIAARDIIQSNIPEECGKHCGKVQVKLLRLPGKDATSKVGWILQAKVFIYMWLGLSKQRSEFMTGLPAGYKVTTEIQKAQANFKVPPPLELHYSGKFKFQLRAHCYQGRNLLGSDSTGLSDPYVRVFCGTVGATSHHENATLNPTWNETLVLDKIYFFGSLEHFISDPPPVVVEIFDRDVGGSDEYIGRVMVKPILVTFDQSYSYPVLEWWPLHRSTNKAGEILAAFELLQLDPVRETVATDVPELDPPVRIDKKTSVLRIPAEITPNLTHTYRIEVLFWGLRRLSRVRLQQISRPYISLEFAGKKISSDIIEDIDKNLNFKNPVKYFDVKLPDKKRYHPPITMLCHGRIAFGQKVLFGVCTVPNISKFLAADDEILSEFDDMDDARTVVLGDEQLHRNGAPPGELKKARSMISLAGSAAEPKRSTLSVSTLDVKGALLDLPGKLRKSYQNLAETVKPDKKTQSMEGIDKSTKSQRSGSPSGSGSQPSLTSSLKPALALEKKSISGSQTNLIKSDPAKYGKSDPGSAKSMTAMTTKTGASAEAKVLRRKGKKKKLALEDAKLLDWWSRYYASMETRRQKEAEALGPEVLRERTDTKNKEKSAKGKVFGAFKKMGKKTKKKMGNLKDNKDKDKEYGTFSGGQDNQAFEPDPDEIMTIQTGVQEEEDPSLISQFPIYSGELEHLSQYESFEDKFFTFNLLRGKIGDDEDDDEESRTVGKFKGSFLIYRLDDPANPPDLVLSRNLPSPEPIGVLVRVYIVKALDLHPADIDNKADPFVIVKLGKQEKNDEENHIKKQLNPVFGKCFSFKAKFPRDSLLTVQIMDWDMLSANDLIGETKIDLENRFFSKHRATCGLKQEYAIHGYNQWPDPEVPTVILDRLCFKEGINKPKYDLNTKSVVIDDRTFYEEAEISDEAGDVKPTKEHLALEVLKHWDDIVPGNSIVPEHVETRPLYSPDHPGVEQGKLEMWIDMFPMELPPPGPETDITPRKPVGYELRCTIWNTDEVKLDDSNVITDEKMSDIYVKGWMELMEEKVQQTDVHWRSLTGEGNFNWRFLFQFDYMAAEQVMVVKREEGVLFKEEEEVKCPARLNIQVFDADMISSDDCLGAVVLNLNKMPRAAKTVKGCTENMLRTDGSWPLINLFKVKRHKGWWPCLVTEPDEEEEEEEDAKKKKKKGKDKDKDKKKIPNLITGKCEIEFQLVELDEAEKAPVGYGRDEPEPLPKPNRPDTSFMWFMNPWKTLKYILWKRFKWTLLKLFLAALLIAVIVLFVYAFPGYSVKAMLGA